MSAHLLVGRSEWKDRLMAKEKRFVKVHSEALGAFSTLEILKDTQTGVCYMSRSNGSSVGLTVLLGADGKPVIDHSL